MKLFIVKAGIQGKLLTRTEDGNYTSRDWRTRKELTFCNTAMDPIRLHNTRGSQDYTTAPVKEALLGNAVFSNDELGGQVNAKYLLSIPFNQVTVLS